MPATVNRGDKNADVALLQQLLRDLGYYGGKVDRDFGPITEDAVQRYQGDHGLRGVEDGTCGPATWRSLEGQFGDLEGLRSDASVERYVGASYGIWHSSYSSPEDRLAAMESAANGELSAVGVPHVAFAFDTALAAGNAVFDHEIWTAQVAREWFETDVAESLSEDNQREIVDTVYHEARHAEQWYNILRLMAGLHSLQADGQFQLPDGSWSTAVVDQRAIAAAVADPMLQSTRTNGAAVDWYESFFGSGSANRDAVLGSISDADDTNDRHGEYRTGLPEEADSWDTGGNVQREYRQYGAGGGPHDQPTLRRGDDDNAHVVHLQQLLQLRGYYLGHQVDGDFGEHTEEAVRSLQQYAQVQGDEEGVAGPATWEELLP
ncbi:MAG: peptidoglycan-binding protein [Actinomycetota bacterium]|nr:peptidoglycan-binding protein [Acidimicrobiia bacterium]MDQ3293252.1 peptidoglycan-binding protein [Actinomycetota bacterium]